MTIYCVDSVSGFATKLNQINSELTNTKVEVSAKLESIDQSKAKVDTGLAIAQEELQFELLVVCRAISNIQDAINSLSLWSTA